MTEPRDAATEHQFLAEPSGGDHPSFERPSTSGRSEMIGGVVLLGALCLGLVYDYHLRLEAFDVGATGRVDLHGQILNGTAPAPYRYRVLVPWILSWVPRADTSMFTAAYDVFFWLALTMTGALIFGLLRRTWSSSAAFGAAALFLASLPVAMRDHGYQPWTWLEAAFIIAAVWSVSDRGAWRWFPLLVVLATLNRETGMLLPVIGGASWFVRRHDHGSRALRWWSLVSLALGVATYGLLRVVRGAADHVVTIQQLADQNLAAGARWLEVRNATLLLAIPLVLSVLAAARRSIPRNDAIVAAIYLIPYLASVAIFGVWHEVRLLVPAIAVALPVLVAGMPGAERRRS